MRILHGLQKRPRATVGHNLINHLHALKHGRVGKISPQPHTEVGQLRRACGGRGSPECPSLVGAAAVGAGQALNERTHFGFFESKKGSSTPYLCGKNRVASNIRSMCLVRSIARLSSRAPEGPSRQKRMRTGIAHFFRCMYTCLRRTEHYKGMEQPTWNTAR